jgi:hypothetical protein
MISIFGTVRDIRIEEVKKTSEEYCFAEIFINLAIVECTSPIAARVISMSNRQLSLEILFRVPFEISESIFEHHGNSEYCILILDTSALEFNCLRS